MLKIKVLKGISPLEKRDEDFLVYAPFDNSCDVALNGYINDYTPYKEDKLNYFFHKDTGYNFESTASLWKRYPAFKNAKVSLTELQEEYLRKFILDCGYLATKEILAALREHYIEISKEMVLYFACKLNAPQLKKNPSNWLKEWSYLNGKETETDKKFINRLHKEFRDRGINLSWNLLNNLINIFWRAIQRYYDDDYTDEVADSFLNVSADDFLKWLKEYDGVCGHDYTPYAILTDESPDKIFYDYQDESLR